MNFVEIADLLETYLRYCNVDKITVYVDDKRVNIKLIKEGNVVEVKERLYVEDI